MITNPVYDHRPLLKMIEDLQERVKRLEETAGISAYPHTRRRRKRRRRLENSSM